MKDSILYYSVGALLYCPANNNSLADSLVNGNFGTHFSLALCLEDTIRDDCVEEAEAILIQTLQTLWQASETMTFYLPQIFIRVRCPQQVTSLYDQLGEAAELISGFVIPKLSLENADSYIDAIVSVNEKSGRPIYAMPLLESSTIIDLRTRYDILYDLKERMDKIRDLILNIRVGGNDLCHVFGFRRRCTDSIHDIRPISNLFADIITVFGTDYVISGPVWEYYNGPDWENGLRRELEDDRKNGFVGKTVIHPKQIPLVNSAYMVSQKDYEDARSILSWNQDSHKLVSGSISGDRMNEYKTHLNWAEKIMKLAEAYGVKEPC